MRKKVALLQTEVDLGKRFEFGRNWSSFLKVISNKRICEAEQSLLSHFSKENWNGKSFLDVGSGSGLFSLAAKRLGASVFSFDFDPQSVFCTTFLKQRFFPNCPNWGVCEGSILDQDFLARVPRSDIVYSWGVLHHTGALWKACSNIVNLVNPDGLLVLAIYNDQGWISQFWSKEKQIYNSLSPTFRIAFAGLVIALIEIKALLGATLLFRPRSFFQNWSSYQNMRGMSRIHDLIDWIGGYPFEVAKPEEVFHFFHRRHFELINLKTCGGGLGCNEFVFRKK